MAVEYVSADFEDVCPSPNDEYPPQRPRKLNTIAVSDIRDHLVWAGVSRYWYSKATDKTPHVGRLFHHLAILPGPDVLQQLFYYCKSLAVTEPFYPARLSMLSWFNRKPSPEHAGESYPFIRLHGINFTHTDLGKFDEALSDYLNTLHQNNEQTWSDRKVNFLLNP